MKRNDQARPRWRRRPRLALRAATSLRVSGGLVAALALPVLGQAAEIDTGDPDLTIHWDNTVKYSTAYRVQSPSDKLTADVNLNDGDNNFRHGFISNRFDLLSELDVAYQDVGVRVSGAGWYDAAYNQANTNPGGSTNQFGPYNQFNTATRDVMGRDVDLLDAFAYGKTTVGDDVQLAGRVGRHSLQWGETLFMGSNGIAGGQQPIDLVKLLSVPGSQFKEIIRPVNQVSGTAQLNDYISVGAYYQLEWQPTILPPSGSYLSTNDFVGAGAQEILAGPLGGPGPGFVYLSRQSNMNGQADGQGGVELRARVPNHDLDLGFYVIRYNDKLPQIYLRSPPTGPNSPGSYQQVYHNGIESQGVSASTTIGDFNVASEISVRENMDMVSNAIPVFLLPGGATANTTSNVKYAVGDSFHANLSTTYLLPPTSLWDGGNFLAEVGYNNRISVTENKSALDPYSTKDALATRFILEPAYYQVRPGLDLSVPIGVGYNPYGRSSVVGAFNGGVSGGGDASIGVKGTYKDVWRLALNLTGYFGPTGPFLTPTNAINQGGSPVISYKQSLADRAFVAFSIQRTF